MIISIIADVLVTITCLVALAIVTAFGIGLYYKQKKQIEMFSRCKGGNK